MLLEDAATCTESAPGLTGRLGTAAVTFMVIAAAAPITVIGGNVPLAIGNGNGVGAPMGFIIAAIVLLLFSVGFVAMTPFVGQAGAFYAYVTLGLGRRLGKGTALVALVAYTAIQVAVYGYLGWALDDLVRHFSGPRIPWWSYSLAAVLAVALLGYRHIELSAKLLGVALILEIAVVILMDLAIFVSGGAEGISGASFMPEAVFSGPIGVAVLFALTGFIGFEATAVFRDEARDPQRTIPRATYLAVSIIGVLYALSCWALIEGVGTRNAVAVAKQTLDGNGNMLLDTAEIYIGVALRDVMNVLLISSLFACVLSFHNVVARYQFVLARQGQLPRPLARVHARHGSPSTSCLVQTVTATLILALCVSCGLDPLVGVFGSLAGIATVGMVLMMLLTSAAVVAYFRRQRLSATRDVVHKLLVPALAVAGLCCGMWLVLSHFTLVTGSSVPVGIVLACIPALALVVGMLIGQRAAPQAGPAHAPSA